MFNEGSDVASESGGIITLTGNATLKDDITVTSTSQYIIIGADGVTLDGGNHKITIDVADFEGLIQNNGSSTSNRAKSCTIKNIHIEDDWDKDTNSSGGHLYSSSRPGRAYLTRTTFGSYLQSGGKITVQNCKVTKGNVSEVGGGLFPESAFARNYGGTILVEKCSYQGALQDSSGGILGPYNCRYNMAQGCEVIVKNCFSDVYITGSGVGAIVAFGFHTSHHYGDVTIENCYSKGEVSSSTITNTNGICGSRMNTHGNMPNYSNGLTPPDPINIYPKVTVKKCYTLIDIKDGAGIVGKEPLYYSRYSRLIIEDCYSISADVGIVGEGISRHTSGNNRTATIRNCWTKCSKLQVTPGSQTKEVMIK